MTVKDRATLPTEIEKTPRMLEAGYSFGSIPIGNAPYAVALPDGSVLRGNGKERNNGERNPVRRRKGR